MPLGTAGVGEGFGTGQLPDASALFSFLAACPQNYNKNNCERDRHPILKMDTQDRGLSDEPLPDLLSHRAIKMLFSSVGKRPLQYVRHRRDDARPRRRSFILTGISPETMIARIGKKSA
jgi:hypothetical protein